MAFVPALNVIEAVMEYTLVNGNKAVNVYNFRDELGEPTSSRLEDLRLILTTWENGSAKAQRSNQVSLTRVSLRDLSIPDGVVLDYTLPAPIVGSVASPAMPANVTFATSFRTGFAGRSSRGRSYWVGLSEGVVGGDFVVTVNANAILSIMQTLMLSAAPLGNFTPVVVSRWNNGSQRANAQVTPITSIIYVDTRVDTQRRRLIGIGS